MLVVLGTALRAELVAASKVGEDRLHTEFLNPPTVSGPWVYWYFMDGNLSREGMTADLEAMKSAGIAFVLFSRMCEICYA
jgi:hypothetical protein